MKIIDLHPSSISSFFSCPYAWYRTYLSDKPIRSIGSAAHVGTAIHKASEVFYRDCIAHNEWVNPVNSAYDDAAVESFQKRVKDDTPSDIKGLDIDSLIITIKQKKQNYLNKARTLCKEQIPIAVEKTYFAKINSSVPMQINGTLDIVNETSIADIKTMNRRNDPKKYWLQQGIYALIKEQNAAEGEKPTEDLLIHRVLTTKDEVDCASICDGMPVTPIDEIKEKAKTLLQTVVKTIELWHKTGDEIVFHGNPNCLTCSSKYCEYWHDCKFKGVK